MRTVRTEPERSPARPPDEPPTAPAGPRIAGLGGLRLAAAAALGAGIVCWALGAGIVALWLFVGAAVALALALPMPVALGSPLFAGLAGWLVDMLPLVVLAA